MDFSNRQTIVFYLSSTKGSVYQSSTGSILEFDLPQDTIVNQEVVNRDKLESTVQDFILSNRITKGNVIFVFSHNLSIDKEFPLDLKKNNEEEVKEFVEIVPFEEPVARAYKIVNKTKVVAVNGYLYNLVKNVVEKNGFNVIAFLPAVILQEISPQLANTTDLSFIAGKFELFKEYSLISSEKPIESQESPTKGEKKNGKNNKNKIYLGVILLCLLFIAGSIGSLLLKSDNPSSSSALPTPQVQIPTPEVSEIPNEDSVQNFQEIPSSTESSTREISP